MPEPAAVINTGSGGSGSIPGGWRTVVIAGGALAALVAVVLQRSKGGAAADAGQGGGLSTSANIALGQVAYEQRKAAGEDSQRDAAISGQIAGLINQTGSLSTGLTDLWNQGQATRGDITSVSGQIADETHEIRTDQATYADPAHAQFYRDQQTWWQNYVRGNVHATLDALSAPPPWLVTQTVPAAA